MVVIGSDFFDLIWGCKSTTTVNRRLEGKLSPFTSLLCLLCFETIDSLAVLYCSRLGLRIQGVRTKKLEEGFLLLVDWGISIFMGIRMPW